MGTSALIDKAIHKGDDRTPPDTRTQPTFGTLPNARGGGGRELGQGGGVTNSLQDFLTSIGQGLQEQISTGFQGDLDAAERAVRGSADRRFDLRSADIRERLGGLGLRFGTDVANQTTQAGVDTEREVSSILGPLAFQGAESSANRRAGGVNLALQLPSLLQQLLGIGEAARVRPFEQAFGFGTGFAPVGSDSRSSSFGNNFNAQLKGQ